MKKLFAIAVAMLALTAVSAQSPVGRNVNYYGVDFSKTKVFAAAEPGYEFKGAFIRINSLVISEWAKYNPGYFLRKRIDVRDISPTAARNEQIDPSEIETYSSSYAINDDDIAEMVLGYDIAEEEGTGLVIIGTLLDKSLVTGNFVVVYFDIASREVLDCRPIVGRAGGFGLRNYWARALYNALKAY